MFRIAILLWFVVESAFGSPVCTDSSDSHRFDCYPDDGATQEKCESRGCCWKHASSSPKPNIPLNVPYCFYPENFGYQLVKQEETATGYMLDLEMQQKGPFGEDITNLKVDVRLETQQRLHVKIFDGNNDRYEVPVETPVVRKKSSQQDYLVSFTHYPFGFAVTRKSTGRVVFNSTAGAMVFEDQFLQLSTLLPSNVIYGLGEHVEGFRLNTSWSRLTLFARDAGGTPFGGTNLYGAHPFYVNIEPDGNANGVFLLNSNAMEIILQPRPALTYRTIGGILDFYIFIGPEPDSVIQQYTEVIGRPFLPPYWSLGFHLCRWGYATSNKTKAIADRMRKCGIPQDVQWNDIDYMKDHLDFTIDSQRFAGLPNLVDDLHQNNQRYIPIVDPGISNADKNYSPYSDGLKVGAFVMRPDTDSPLVGKVWPGNTVFPDYFNAKTIQYWQEQIQSFHAKVKHDGLWIDMNEPSNFVDGSVNGCPASKYETPPYDPHVGGGHLTAKTICMGARQASGIHYNLHSLYGHSELIASSKALHNILKRRTLVISRSTFPSSGKYGGHWLGDNKSQWPDLRLSIPGVLNFNLFGIPLVGADICGFNGNTQKDLCSRWTQLGAFYPFSRNHNTKGATAQDPPSLGEDVVAIARKVLLLRYSLLPYLYTLFFNAHTQGSTVARSLMFEFPKDSKTYSISNQFLWGPALMISPALIENSNVVNAYFPNDLWYDFYTGNALEGHGQYIYLDTPMDKINLHIRAGYILAMQQPSITTADSRKNPFSLLVALRSSGDAAGELYLDDGDSLDVADEYTLVHFNVKSSILVSSPSKAGYTPSAQLTSVTVLGVMSKPGKVSVDGTLITTFSYDTSSMVLQVKSLQLNFVKLFTIAWE